MKKLLYVHGYNGMPEGYSCNLIKSVLPEGYTIEGVDYDQNDCALARQQILEYIKTHNMDLVIGSSLGGFITLTLPGIKRFVINPCCLPSVELPKIDVPQKLIDTYKPFEPLLDHISEEDRQLVRGFFGDHDELLGDRYIGFFESRFGHLQHITSGHHLSMEGAKVIAGCLEAYFQEIDTNGTKPFYHHR